MLTASTLFVMMLDVAGKKEPVPVKAYHHGNLREALVEAGLELIHEKGPRGLTLREISARVGVSRMAAYRHFADKDDLLREISEGGFRKLLQDLSTAKKRAGSTFHARLTALGTTYLRFAYQNPSHYAVMFGSGFLEKPQAPSGVGMEAFLVLESTIREGQEKGEVRQGDPLALANIAWATVHGLSLLRLETDMSRSGKGRELAELMGDVLASGLRPLEPNQY